MKKILLILALYLSLFGDTFKYVDSYDAAVDLAEKEHKPLLLFMSQKNCLASKYMRETVFNDNEVSGYIKEHYVVAKLNVNKNSAPEKLQVNMTPTFHFILPNSLKFRPSIVGGKNPKEFLNTLTQANNKDYFYLSSVYQAPNNKILHIKDTDTDLGRYTLQAKELELKNLIDAHGHLCDGLVITFVEMSEGLSVLFPKGVVDRTDLKVVVRNKPAFVDGSALMSGARINFKTLSLDNSLGLDIIIQRISTNIAVKVSLKDPSFLNTLRTKKRNIKKIRYSGKNVSAKEIDELEVLSKEIIQTLLNTKIDELVEVEVLEDYKFKFNTQNFSKRTDAINKSMPR